MIEALWLGMADSLQVYLDAMKAVSANPELYAGPHERDEDGPRSRLLEYHGNVAVLNVEGSLVPGAKRWYRYFGITGYDEIAMAAQEAAGNEDIDTIVARYASGGGSASGVEAAASVLKDIDQNVKPIYSFTDNAAFSAAYWLYSATRKQSVSAMGQIGSIGAIATHVSYKDYLDKAGIKYTVFREGEYKALGQPFEELDEKTKHHMQERLHKANSFFLSAVVANRGVDLADASLWAEGKTFFGREGVAVGLADEVVTLQELVGRLIKSSGQTAHSANYNGGDAVSKTKTSQEGGQPSVEEPNANLTEEQIARIQMGVDQTPDLQDGEGESGGEPKEPKLEDGSAETPQLEEVEQLKAELTAANEQTAKLEAELEAQAELQEAMKTIVLGYANKLTISLGGSAVDLAHLDAATAVKHFESVNAQFSAAFKIGPTSNHTKLEDEEQPTAEEPEQASPKFASPVTQMVREHQQKMKR